MTITAATADQLEALALSIFDPHFDPVTDTANATGLSGPDAATDAQYYALIAPVMLAIDGRTMATGFRYTLNVTNALQGRPKHWFMEISEYNMNNVGVAANTPAYCGLVFTPNVATGYSPLASSFGRTIGLATCAAICHAWAQIVRLWLAGNYPLAVPPAA